MGFKVKDHYYKKAKENSYLARSIFKLEEIDKKYKIMKAHYKVIDFGYYPGSWVQYCAEKINEHGRIVGVDIQPVNSQIDHLENVKLFEMDAFNIQSLGEIGEEKPFDLVLSDMAPKTTGIKSVDQIGSLNLVEKIFDLLPLFLRPKGNLVVKVFESNDCQIFLKSQRNRFEEWNYLRPKSTRSVSKEFFVIGKGFKA